MSGGGMKSGKSGWVGKWLHAVEFNEVHSINLLIKKGVDINHPFKLVRTEQGHRRRLQTAIFIAVRKNYKTLSHMLIKAGCNVNHTDDMGETPLFVAVNRGKEALVKMLVEAGVNVNHVNRQGKNVVYSAVEMGLTKILSYLITHGCKVDDRHTCFRLKNSSLHLALCLHIKYIEEPSRTRMRFAHGNLEMLTMLVKACDNREMLKKSFKGVLMLLSDSFSLNNIAELHSDVCIRHIPRMLLQHGGRPGVYCNFMDWFPDYSCLPDRYFSPKLVLMWWEVGMDLTNDETPQYLLDGRPVLAPHEEFFRKLWEQKKHPRSLKSLCRVLLLEVLDTPLWSSIDQLELPVCLLDYLKMNEFDSI